MQRLDELHLRLKSLSVFRGLRTDPVIAALENLLDNRESPAPQKAVCYGNFAGLLLERGGNWSEYLFSRALRDENEYVRQLARGEEISPLLQAALKAELSSLSLLGNLCPQDLLPEGLSFPVAGWETSPLDFAENYHPQMANIQERGYGAFADHHMFLLKGEEPIPVLHPDSIRLDALTGYEKERAQVVANTLSLLNGGPAANVLLYGDSGTGKSTCVKAIANEYFHRGLRLIELRKNQLNQIPMLIDKLSGNPLKFILFIDDLSFTAGNDHFSALKAILEGSISARTSNIAIYATSNRRHLVREQFADRRGDDVHLRDTLEEVASLSERFGLTLTFLRPDKELYLSIVESYCRVLDLPFDEETCRAAEAFAISRGGRSPRTAKQFAENLAAAQGQPATEE